MGQVIVRRAERGQAVPLLVLVIVAAVGAAALIAGVGQRAERLARAQAAADAVALAGAAGGGELEQLAAANGAVIVASDASSGRYSATVEVDGARAVAAASIGRADPALRGLQPALVAAVRTAEHLLGEPLVVVSGYRSTAEQRWLWERRGSRPYPVARPGTSAHELGLAIDVASAQVSRLARLAARAGLCQPLPHTDPVHFELCPRT